MHVGVPGCKPGATLETIVAAAQHVYSFQALPVVQARTYLTRH